MKTKLLSYITILWSALVMVTCKNLPAPQAENEADLLLKRAFKLRKSEPDSAIYYAQQVLNTSVPAHQKALANRRIGLARKYQGRYEEAIQTYQRALELDENNEKGKMTSFNLIADVYKLQKKPDKAVEYYIESIKIGETLSPAPKELGDAYVQLGNIFASEGDFEKADAYFELAITNRKEIKDTVRLASTHLNKGNFYFRTDSMDLALKEYDKSILLNEAINNKSALAVIYHNLGEMYSSKGEYEKLIAYFNESLRIKRGYSDYHGVANTANSYCNYYLGKKKYQKAISYCDTSMLYAIQVGDLELLSNAEYLLYKIAGAQNNKTEALDHYEKHSFWKDSLNSNARKIAIQEIISEYEQEKEVASIKQKNQQQRLWYIAAILFSLLALAALIPYLIATKKLQKTETEKRKIAEEKRIQEEELRKAEEGKRIEEEKLYKQVISGLEKEAHVRAVNAEIDAKLAERAKVSSVLHDSVCGDLVAAKLNLDYLQHKMTGTDKAAFEKGIGLLDGAYVTCRKISHELAPPMLTKFGLASAIEDLCENYSTPAIQIQFAETTFDERLDQRQELILFQTIQELIQNILKHADATEANIQLTDYGDALNIIVEDNGKGFDADEISKENGIGLQKISTRIEHLGGTVNIDASPRNGTTVIIDVPKISV